MAEPFLEEDDVNEETGVVNYAPPPMNLPEGLTPEGLALLQAQVAPQPMQAPEYLKKEAKTQEEKLMEMLQGQLIDRSRQAIEEQKAYVGDLERQGPGLNLAPAAALVDTWTGSDLSKGYRAPLSPEEYKRLVLYGKQNLSDKEIDLLKAQMAPFEKMQKQEGTESRFQQKFLQSAEEKIAKDYDNVSKDLEKLGGDYANLEKTLATGTQQAINSMAGQFARLIAGEKGVLTDVDVARAMPSTMQRRFNDLKTYFDNPNQPPPPNVVNEMIGLVRQAKKYIRQGYMNRAKRTHDKHRSMRSYEGIEAVDKLYDSTVDAIGNSLYDVPLVQRKKKEKKSTLPTKTSGGLTPEEQKELEQLEALEGK